MSREVRSCEISILLSPLQNGCSIDIEEIYTIEKKITFDKVK